jgi:hypothetical protein
MLLAFAVLLIHPQIAATTNITHDSSAVDTPAAISAASVTLETEGPAVTVISSPDTVQPTAEANTALPAAPAPAPAPEASIVTPASMPLIKAADPMVISVKELQAENRRKLLLWKGLVVASSGAATFDAVTTRYAITSTGARELDPLLRPFAGNASLFAAIQVAPALLDFASHKMIFSRHSLLRKTWWIPQSASFATSIFCGAHNLAYH